MSKVDIISGFLGAGKTTLIKKLIKESLGQEKIVLIENEFGEIGIDGSFMKEAGIEITEMNSGCICCSLVGDFSVALKEVIETYHPDRVIIEPSGVGKLSDVIKAIQDVHDNHLELNSFVSVIDAKKCKIYSQNFGEFFNNQIEYASTIILSRTQDITEEQLHQDIHIIKELNPSANIITTPWEKLSGDIILNTMENKNSLEDILMKEEDIYPDNCEHHHEEEHHCCGGHGHHHEDEHECCHGHHHHEEHHCCGGHGHHHEDEHECCHGHHHHEEHNCCGGHGHHHEDEHECCHGHHHEDEHHCCGGHGHHEHHHHADEVFTSLGIETIHTYTQEKLAHILEQLSSQDYGYILRAKGILQTPDKEWLHFDFVPGEYEIRYGSADYTGRLCVIGENLKEKDIRELFGE